MDDKLDWVEADAAKADKDLDPFDSVRMVRTHPVSTHV